MKNLKLFLLGLMLCAALPSQAWDRTRHDAIAYIAECNLTPRLGSINHKIGRAHV